MRSLLRTHWPIAHRPRRRRRRARRRRDRVLAGRLLRRLVVVSEPRLRGRVRAGPARAATRRLIAPAVDVRARPRDDHDAQHLAGLVTGVLVYALMLRLRLPRWLATVGAAVVVLDAYAIALEQQVLAEAFFTLALVAVVLLRRRPRPRAGVSRPPAGCCSRWPPRCAPPRCSPIPVWLTLCAVVASRAAAGRARRARARCSRCSPTRAWHTADTGRFGLTQADGWFLYGQRGGDRRLRRRRHPARGATAVRPQRARPPRGRGVPHLERRRPGPARVRRHQPRPATAGALQPHPARLRVRDHPRPPRPLRRPGVGRLHSLLRRRGACRAATPTSPCSYRSSAGWSETTRSRAIAGSRASCRTCSRPPSACAPTTARCTRRGR